MSSIHFRTTGLIKEMFLIDAFSTIGPFKHVEKVKNYFELETTLEGVLYVQMNESSGKLNFEYNIFLPDAAETTIRRRIDILSKLAEQSRRQLLTDDEGVNPYIYIHIAENGTAKAVSVDPELLNESDELAIDDVYPLSPGSFATDRELDPAELNILKDLWSGIFVINNINKLGAEFYFEQYRNQFNSLIKYSNYYLITPSKENQWRSEEERSQMMIDIMVLFSMQSAIDICVFPANSSIVKNITGGSDSESHCITIVAGVSEKIVFKPLRKSW